MEEIKREDELMKVVEMKKIALTVNEAADYTGIGRNLIRNLINWGKLSAIHIGNKSVIRVETLYKFLEANEGVNIANRHEVIAV